MITIIDEKFKIDLRQPIDISMEISNDINPIAWYLGLPKIEPVQIDDWIGSVNSGKSATNFNNIYFNPHAHGTHTECLGHITKDFYSINDCLKHFFFKAQLLSVSPEMINNDWLITKKQLVGKIKNADTLIIRTLPNSATKKTMNYSHTNPAYFEKDAVEFMVESGIQHLLVDLPSIDKEKDEGKLLCHKAFWQIDDVNIISDKVRKNATITEFIFVSDEIEDGDYILNLQIASINNDATPSKPILYKIIN